MFPTDTIGYIILFMLGSVIGSFLSAYTFRWPRGISIVYGRSFCPNCKSKINWFDNIPVLSFLLLAGKCRNCSQNISVRYPLIEISCAGLFLLTYYFWNLCGNLANSPLCFWKDQIGPLSLPYLLLIVSLMVAIFVIDFENQLIPDYLVYLLLITTALMPLISNDPEFYKLLLSGFAGSCALLLLHLLTRGKGMGLGDVKLALGLGVFFGWPNVTIWLYLSFTLGAVVGLLLIATGRAKFGKAIAFGPFLVLSFFLTLFWGDYFANFFYFFL